MQNDTSTQAVIRTDELTKVYGSGDDAHVAVDSLDLHIAEGEVFGFLGPNGAGKSTTINMLLGLTSPTAGSASILGFDPQTESEAMRSRIGVLPEGLGLYPRLTGRRHLEFAIRWMDANDRPETLLDRVGLSSTDAGRSVGAYSTGMKQRLALAMALVDEPEVIILDEPSSGLDPHGIRRLRRIVREEVDRGATVFFSSHLLDQVEAVADRIGILSGGRLVAVDTIGGLRETVGSGTELELRVTEPVRTVLDRITGVRAWEQDDGIVRVETSDSRAKARVVSQLVDAGVPIVDIDSTQASLEDVFTAYTSEEPTSHRHNDRPERETAVSVS